MDKLPIRWRCVHAGNYHFSAGIYSGSIQYLTNHLWKYYLYKYDELISSDRSRTLKVGQALIEEELRKYELPFELSSDEEKKIVEDLLSAYVNASNKQCLFKRALRELGLKVPE